MSRPALLIAGTHSGCGKTTVTLGVMAALARRGHTVQPFKCGPDFIDPSLHRMVTGRVSRNLDIRMCGEPFVRSTFARHAPADGIAVVEGVMGLFDGGEGSAATLAKTLDLPVLLVVDVRSAAESVAAVVHGFATLDPGVRLAGVICNRIGSDKHRDMVAAAIQAHCTVPVLGFLPRHEAIAIPSRHLGLHMGEEHPLAGDGVEQLIALIENHLDLDLMTRIAADRRDQDHPAEAPPPVAEGERVRIGVARDAAFCFYYEDNLDLLRAAGAELVFFSPLDDEQLPTDLAGLYLGGGYPELHAAQLSANRTMRDQIRRFAEAGRPVYGECGGFMYLCRSITDLEGNEYAMTGLYPFAARMQSRLRSLGYRRPQVMADCLLAPAGTVLHGHEFHYSTIDIDTAAVPTAYRLDDGRPEGFTAHGDQTLAGYVHLHWGRTPEVANRFVTACRQAGSTTRVELLSTYTPQPLNS
jgi:cobyrinic acid a,c-diamide synthase